MRLPKKLLRLGSFFSGFDVDRKGLLGDVPVLPCVEEIMAVVQEEEKLVPQERGQPPTVERAPVLHFLAETVEVVLNLTPTERGQRRTVRRCWKRQSWWSGWSRVNECNSGTAASVCGPSRCEAGSTRTRAVGRRANGEGVLWQGRGLD